MADRREVSDLDRVLQGKSATRHEWLERAVNAGVPGEDGCVELGVAGKIDSVSAVVAQGERRVSLFKLRWERNKGVAEGGGSGDDLARRRTRSTVVSKSACLYHEIVKAGSEDVLLLVGKPYDNLVQLESRLLSGVVWQHERLGDHLKELRRNIRSPSGISK